MSVSLSFFGRTETEEGHGHEVAVPVHSGRAGRDKKFHLQQAFFKNLKRPSSFCSNRKGNGGRRRVGEEHAHSFTLKAYEW